MSAGEEKRGGREITGRHVFYGFLAAFGVVLVANMTLLVLALSGFPGLVSSSPYTEGQRFDAELRAERALGWRIGAEWEAGRLAVRVDDAGGEAVRGLLVRATVGRPATAAEDRTLTLAPAGGLHAAPMDLAPGRWRVEITAERQADGARYVITDEIFVRDAGDGT